MHQSIPMPTRKALLAFTPEGEPCVRLISSRCAPPSVPGGRALEEAVATVLSVLVEAHGFRLMDRDPLRAYIARDVLARAGYAHIECGPVKGFKGRLVDQAISRLGTRDLVQSSWRTASWLRISAGEHALP